MAFRNIMIENPAYISLNKNRIMIRTDSEHAVPTEDISALLIENRQTIISAAALSALGQSGCAVFVCDEKHMPAAVLTPFGRHSRELSVIRSQMDMSGPLKKRLWALIVKNKIDNQSRCLRICGHKEEAYELKALSVQVRSGDPENIEATAAMKYFPVLFGESFTRSRDDGRNAMLNYGYAIIRGYTARCLTVYGFLPALGLHHRSELNNFNLADDLMEPFRPVVDLVTAKFVSDEDELSPEKKKMLFNCLNLDIISDGQRHSVSYAIERYVQSLVRSLEEGEPKLAETELTELRQHRYE